MRLTMKPSHALIATLLMTLSGGAIADLVFDDPWSPLAPPGRTMAGFMTLSNTGDDPIALIDGQSPQFGRIEIHDMVNDEGVMRMRRLDQLLINPGEEVVLKSGGFHIMLMEPRGTFEAGDQIELVLLDEAGQRHATELEVRPRQR